MYEKMYEKAKAHDADIVKCDFYKYDSYANPTSVPYSHGIANLKNIYKENAPFKAENAPLILAYHSSVWASLYKANFVQKFKFIENKPYVDFPFMFEVLTQAEKIVITYDRFNHYRMEQNQNSSTKCPGIKVLNMIDMLTETKLYLQKNDLMGKYSEAFYYHASKCCAGFFYNNLSDEIRKAFYNGILDFYKDFPKDFKYTYFEENLKIFVLTVLDKNYEKLINKKRKTAWTILIQIIACLIPCKKLRREFRSKFS